jgi:hypothetical protein
MHHGFGNYLQSAKLLKYCNNCSTSYQGPNGGVYFRPIGVILFP